MAGFGGLTAGVYRRRVLKGSDRLAFRWTAASGSGFESKRLARTVEADIIPRLLLLHREDDGCGPKVPPGPTEIADFSRTLLCEDFDAATNYVYMLRANGASVEAVFLQLFAPAARLLGDLWREDLASFAEVTIGLSRLQQLMSRMRETFEEPGEASWNGRRVLLAPAPGEQHSFGLSLVASFLRRSGWHVDVSWAADERDILRSVRADTFDIVGFSLSCDNLLDRLAAMIQAVRRASANKSMKVMVGGSVFAADPNRAAAVGADVTALDAVQAVAQAGRIAAPLVTVRW